MKKRAHGHKTVLDDSKKLWYIHVWIIFYSNANNKEIMDYILSVGGCYEFCVGNPGRNQLGLGTAPEPHPQTA